MKTVFEQCSLGTLRLKNRIIRSATHEGMALADGMPSGDLAGLYERLAEGGAGAIITGYVGVAQNGRTFANMRMFDSERYVEVYRAITARLRPHGTPLILQLAHGGSWAQSSLTGQDVVAPSRQERNQFGDACRALDDEEIGTIIRAFVQAIVNARKAGFDGVQLHAAHGFLLSSFLSPVLNRRADQWGGTVENRARILREILLRARREVGDFPILVKISARDSHRHGLTDGDAVAIARILQDSSCDAIEVSCGFGDQLYTVRTARIPMDAILHFIPWYRNMSPLRKGLAKLGARLMSRGYRPLHNYNVDAAERIKRAVDIPVIVVGGIRNLRDIGEIVQARNIDFVSLSRPFVIEPDIVRRFQSGVQDRSRCIDCGYCLIGVTARPLTCYYGHLPRQ